MNNQKEKILDCIILLNGNHLVLKIPEKNIELMESELIELLNNPASPTFAKMCGATFKAQSVIGWYFREPLENPTKQIIAFMDKKLPNSDDGEDWKKE